MKRFHNKQIKIPKLFISGILQKSLQGNTPVWLYSNKRLSAIDNLVASRLDVDVPLLDVYALHIGTIKGVLVGFLLDTPAKCVKHSNYHLLVHSKQLHTIKFSELKQSSTPLQLNYQIKELSVYSLGAYGSMVTLGHDTETKEGLAL